MSTNTKTSGITGSSQYAEIEDIILALKDYEQFGHRHGDFLTAVLENNLSKVMAHADVRNRDRLHTIVMFVYNRMDSRCWGSADKVEAWMAHRGHSGLASEEQ